MTCYFASLRHVVLCYDVSICLHVMCCAEVLYDAVLIVFCSNNMLGYCVNEELIIMIVDQRRIGDPNVLRCCLSWR